MQRLSGKGPSTKDLKGTKLLANSSKNKKDQKMTSSKNLKTMKGLTLKHQNSGSQTHIKQNTSPQTKVHELDNDYGVNPYYAKHKVKTSHKKESEEMIQNTEYSRFNTTKDALSKSQYQITEQKYNKAKNQDSDYAESAFQKIKLPSNKGLINSQGKFISRGPKVKQQKNQSFHNNSSSKQSFSLNFNSRQESKYRKKGKSKSKKKILQQQKSMQYKTKSKSTQKVKNNQSYFQKNRQAKHKNDYYTTNKKEQKIKQIVIRQPSIHQIQKAGSLNSKTTSIGIQTQPYSSLCLTQNNAFIQNVKEQIIYQLKNKQVFIRKEKFTQIALKQRIKCIHMLSRICGALNTKRQAFFLATYYLDSYISKYSYQSMKLISLGCLTLAIKMDNADMITKFCINYLYNPQKTVKKNRSSNQLKSKQKRQSMMGSKQQPKSILQGIINVKISEERKINRQDFSLQEILDCENHIMIKFGFKLMVKTIAYWIDMLTALWDSYVQEFCPRYSQTLLFRNDKNPVNWSYLVQMIQIQNVNMGIYKHSRISLVLAAIYLISRMSLQYKKEETPWDQICRFYKVSLAKTTNLIFCDGVGINVIFGDFLTLFELSMTDIIQCIQLLSKSLQPNLIRNLDYRKVEGLNRQDRITTHITCEQIYKNHIN